MGKGRFDVTMKSPVFWKISRPASSFGSPAVSLRDPWLCVARSLGVCLFGRRSSVQHRLKQLAYQVDRQKSEGQLTLKDDSQRNVTRRTPRRIDSARPGYV